MSKHPTCLDLTPSLLSTQRLALRSAIPNLSLALFSLLLLGACSIAPPAQENSDWLLHRDQLGDLDSWQFQGRVNVRYDDESHTPRIRWRQQDVEYDIRLWGTFNAGNTLITGRPGAVTMEQDGDIYRANSPEDLILSNLGYELPVSQLEYWIKGIPDPGSDAELSFNELNQLTSLEQEGWTIIYTDPRQYGELSLPRRVELTRPLNDIRLRFIGLNWTFGDDIN